MLSGHFNRTDTYVVKRAQGMTDWLLTYTLDGEGYFLVAGRKRYCHPGDVTLLRPHTPHQYGTVQGQHWHFVWAHFPSYLVETQLLSKHQLSIHPVGSETLRERIFQAFQRVLMDMREQSPFWKELSENALREILLLIAQRENRQMDARIEETLHLLSGHMHEPISITSLAQAVGLSSSRLSHLFKEMTGKTIIQTLNHMRVQQAALLITHMHRNASEAAEEVGFQNYNHFAAQFRKVYGCNPRDYANASNNDTVNGEQQPHSRKKSSTVREG